MQSVQDAKRRNRKGRLFRGARGTPEPRQTKPSRPGLHPGQSSDGGVKGGLTPPPLPYLAGSTRLSLTKSQRVVKISAQFTHNAATIRAQGLDCPTRAVNGRILAPNHGSRLGQKDLDCRTWPWPAACRGGSGCPISGLRRRPVWQPGLSWPLAGVGPGAATAEHFAALYWRRLRRSASVAFCAWHVFLAGFKRPKPDHACGLRRCFGTSASPAIFPKSGNGLIWGCGSLPPLTEKQR